MTPDPQQTLSMDEAAELLGLSRRTLGDLVATRQIGVVRYSSKARFTRAQLAAFINAHTIDPAADADAEASVTATPARAVPADESLACIDLTGLTPRSRAHLAAVGGGDL